MKCNSNCPLSYALIAIPLGRLARDGLQQSMNAQLPWWLWLVIILLALIAIAWWQLYLRPLQAREVHELEHHLDDGHGNHHQVENHTQTSRVVSEDKEQMVTDYHAVSLDQETVSDSMTVQPSENTASVEKSDLIQTKPDDQQGEDHV